MSERFIDRHIPEVAPEPETSYMPGWEDVYKLAETEKVLKAMVIRDPELAEHRLETKLMTLIQKLIKKNPERLVAARDMFVYHKTALEELRASVALDEKAVAEGWTLFMGVYSRVVFENRYFLPQEVRAFLESAFRRPLLGEKPFTTEEGTRVFNNAYSVSEPERQKLLSALDMLIVRYSQAQRAIDATIGAKSFVETVSASGQVNEPETEKRAA